ncbi:hypothetical protein LTR36_008724 [Oleoguttula mirabilis]|uniref:Uncharacterized protein n=1 Tax=Oleoguttula mirabilis TaxID=1507867 RepID=A0AAV9JU33_9PEZI|nr:hypothetical protein LTR36_008724 [Oleoguttula mirabilis]
MSQSSSTLQTPPRTQHKHKHNHKFINLTPDHYTTNSTSISPGPSILSGASSGSDRTTNPIADTDHEELPRSSSAAACEKPHSPPHLSRPRPRLIPRARRRPAPPADGGGDALARSMLAREHTAALRRLPEQQSLEVQPQDMAAGMYGERTEEEEQEEEEHGGPIEEVPTNSETAKEARPAKGKSGASASSTAVVWWSVVLVVRVTVIGAAVLVGGLHGRELARRLRPGLPVRR